MDKDLLYIIILRLELKLALEYLNNAYECTFEYFKECVH